MQTQSPRPDWYHTDNGFSSLVTMERLHEPLVSLTLTALAGCRGNVIDLGCGNGALLAKICAANEGLVPYGIDVNAERLAHVRDVLPHYADNFLPGNFFDVELWDSGRRYALAILMAGRLLEVPRTTAEQLVRTLKARCDQVLVYVYPDWAQQGFDALIKRAGLRVHAGARPTAGLLAWESPEA